MLVTFLLLKPEKIFKKIEKNFIVNKNDQMKKIKSDGKFNKNHIKFCTLFKKKSLKLDTIYEYLKMVVIIKYNKGA